jgi:Tol biopolymer transport system component
MNQRIRSTIGLVGALALLGLTTGIQAQEITRISVSDTGAEGNGWSAHPSMSTNGRFVLFKSEASNLVDNDSNGVQDVFVRDLQLGRTERVSIPPAGGEFRNSADLDSSAADGSISADGNFALFIVNDPDSFGCPSRVYVRNRAAAQTRCVDVGANGDPNDAVTDYAISADSNWIALTYDRAGPYLLNRNTGTATRVGSADADYFNSSVSLSADGAVLAFTDTVNTYDVEGNWFPHKRLFTFERTAGNQTLIESNLERNHDIAVSGNGRFLGFTIGTPVSDPVNGDYVRSDIWVLDRSTGARDLITQSPQGGPSDESSYYPQMSDDGRFMAFDSHASNLTNPGIEPGRGLRIYFFDRQTREATLVSKALQGQTYVRVSGANPSISGDGRYVAFRSGANDLVPGDTNETSDTFLWDRLATSGAPISLTVVAEPAILWPPNRRLVNVAVSTPVEGAQGSVSLSLRIEDEYGAMSTPETAWTGGTVRLEASRHGSDPDGRTYTIVVVATDASGQRTEARTQVIVPHDMRATH